MSSTFKNLSWTEPCSPLSAEISDGLLNLPPKA